MSVLIFVVAAYSGGFLKVPKGGGVSTGESLRGGGGRPSFTSAKLWIVRILGNRL